MANDKLTEEEMASLFDQPIGPVTPELVASFGPDPRKPHSMLAQKLSEADAYQKAAEAAFKAGLVVVKGDATYLVRDELKRMGCKWHALRERWVAPDKASLQAARVVVNRGPLPPVANDPQPVGYQKLAMGPQASRFAKIEKQKNPSFVVNHVDPRAVLLELANRGLIKLQPARMQAMLDGEPPTEDELSAAFAETDKAFDL